MWPDFFPAGDGDQAVPAVDSDMTGFDWEDATPESVASDFAAIENLVRQNAAVSVREEAGDAPQSAPALPDPVWP